LTHRSLDQVAASPHTVIGDRQAGRHRPRRSPVALPHARLDDAVFNWVDCFASSKRSPRADLPVVADQTRDYRQKVTAVAVSFEDAHQRPMLVSDLFTTRRAPSTPAPSTLSARADPRVLA
jgi:hypothetical protein